MKASHTATRRFVKSDKGFTLPEVLVTILIMGILFGIASSFWFGIVEGRKVDSATNQVAADVRLSHSSAANQLTEYLVAYNPNGTVTGCAAAASADYCLLKKTGTSTYEETARFLPDGTQISGTTLNATGGTLATLLGLGSGTRTLKLNSNGSAEATDGLTPLATGPSLTISSDDGAPAFDVQVTPATARVKIVG